MNKTPKAFITYSHKDKEANNKLKTCLAVMVNEGKIALWDDNEILPGDKWYKDISENLPNSDILLYLVSAESLASKNCNKELTEALNEKIRVVPIILEDCDWRHHQLSGFEVLPDKGKPINPWEPDSSVRWQNVVDGIRKVVNNLQTPMGSPAITPEEELCAELAFQQGNFLLMLGQIDRAKNAYSHAIELNSNDADAYCNRGTIFSNRGEIDQAIEDYTKAIEIKPDSPEAYNNRGEAHGRKDEFDRAIDDYTKAIELKPDFPEAYYNRGIEYVSIGEFDLAIDDYTKAIELKPNYVDTYVNRGVAYSDKGEYGRAIEDYTKAIRLNPHSAEAYNNRGEVHGTKGDLDLAIADFSKAIKLKPDFPEAHDNLDLAYAKRNMG